MSVFITARLPIVPVGDGLACFFIQRLAFKLAQRYDQLQISVPDQDVNLGHAVIFRCHLKHLNFKALGQWCRWRRSPYRREWHLQTILKIVVPAHCPLGFVIGVHHDLKVNPFLSDLVFANTFRASHVSTLARQESGPSRASEYRQRCTWLDIPAQDKPAYR
jgi:hypothetical protein